MPRETALVDMSVSGLAQCIHFLNPDYEFDVLREMKPKTLIELYVRIAREHGLPQQSHWVEPPPEDLHALRADDDHLLPHRRDAKSGNFH